MGWAFWLVAGRPVAAFAVLAVVHGANLRARRERTRRLP